MRSRSRPAARERGGADQLGRAHLVLLGPQEHEVAAVIGEIARVGWLVAAVDLAIALEQRVEIGGQGAAEVAEGLALDQAVERDSGGRPRLRPGRGRCRRPRRRRECSRRRRPSRGEPARSRPASRHAACMSPMAAAAWATLPVACTRPAPSLAVSRRARGPIAATCRGIGSSRLTAPTSGFRKRISSCPSNVHRESRWRGGRARRGRILPCRRASPGRAPCVRRAVKPVEMPKSMRPGASAFRLARALAVTGAMRFEGISTPVARRIATSARRPRP